MLLQRIFLAGIFLPGTLQALGRSQRSIGLIQDVEGMTKAEAMTMSARGTSALFYNPACLIYNRFDFRLGGIEAIVDKRLLDTGNEQSERKKIGSTSTQSSGEDDMKRAYDLLLSDQALNAVANARLIDFAIPYIGIQNFMSTELTAGHVPDAAEPTVQADFMLRTGTIGGIAMKIGPWAIGYSKYFLIESNLEERLTLDQIDSIKSQIEVDPSAANSIDYSSFTRATYGNTDGENLGLLYQPFDDNPSGFGLTVLNAGGSSFRRELPRQYSKLKPYQSDLEQKVDELGIEMNLPEKVPQMVNAGLMLGHGGSRHDAFTINFALDYDDIGGSYLDENKKFAASTEFGLMLPDELAMLLRQEISFDSKKNAGTGFYWGLLGLKAIAGARANDRYAYGVSLLGHAGTRHLSFLKFTLQGMVEKPLDKALTQRVGAHVNIGLTFMLIN